jgi:hypothetical protein
MIAIGQNSLSAIAGFKAIAVLFALLPNGRNIRSFELRKINKGKAKIIRPAPNKI